MIIGRVLRSGKRIFDCEIIKSKEKVQAVAKRELLRGDGVVVGDLVTLTPQQNSKEYELIEVHPRKNVIHRKIVRENKVKILASNIDLILIISSVSKPDYKSALIDRYLIRSIEWDIPAVVVFHKMDELPDELDLEFEIKKFKFLGVKSFFTSSVSTNDQKIKNSMKELKEALIHKTTILLGQSGVGKSRLISTLSDGKINLVSKELAKKVNKGAHTTTWSEIIQSEEFSLVDSPGIRSMSINDINPDELISYFPDLVPYIEKCKFTNCSHEENSKGCAFLELEEENIEDQIIRSRLNSYQKMKNELGNIPHWVRT